MSNVSCAKCKSKNVSRHGFTQRKGGLKIPKYDCKDCGYCGMAKSNVILKKGAALDYKLTKRQISILSGLLLGDGHLNKKGCFVCNRSIKDKRYNNYIKNVLSELFSQNISNDKYQESIINNRKIRSTCYKIESLTTKELKEFRDKWYDEYGTKIIPQDLELTNESLAYWYLDDGSIHIGYTNNSIILCTNNFTKNEVLFLSQLLKNKFNLSFNIYKTGKHQNPDRGYILKTSTKENIVKFSQIVDRYIVPEMGMSEDRISGVNKSPWKDQYIAHYLSGKISRKEFWTR